MSKNLITNKDLTLLRLNEIKNDWEIENLFYQNVHPSRLVKLLNHFELLKKTKKCPGSIIECGVLKGNSLIRFAIFRDYLNMYNKKLYAFDAFGTFPKSYLREKNSILRKEKNFATIHDKNTGKGFKAQIINKLLRQKKIKNYKLIKGDIFETLDKFIKKNKKLKISFLHLDMDVYLPTLYALKKFYKYIAVGGIVVIDDFKTLPGATQATKEFLKLKKRKIQVLNNLKSIYYFVK